MKKLAIVLIMTISSGLFISVGAQTRGNVMHDSTRMQGMHRKMMLQRQFGNMQGNEMQCKEFTRMHEDRRDGLSPVKQLMPYMMLIRHLPNMQERLNLTDDQVSKLVDLQAGFEKQKIDLKADLTKKELKLKNLLKNNASSKEIGEQLTACSTVRISIAVAAYETADKMKSVLNDAQKQKLDRKIDKIYPGMNDSEK